MKGLCKLNQALATHIIVASVTWTTQLVVHAAKLKSMAITQDDEQSIQLVQVETQQTESSDQSSYLTACFIIGCLILPYSLLFTIKNEWKIVQVIKLIDRAVKECKTIDNKLDLVQPQDKDLVCVSGNSFSKIDLFDRDFGVVAEDSYRLKRKVEVF